MSMLREFWVISEATRGESRPGNAKDKQVVFYYGQYTQDGMKPGRHNSPTNLHEKEERFESLSGTFDWLKDRVLSGDSYYIDVREE